MTVLITTQNVALFQGTNPKLKIYQNTVNTSIIKCSEKTFVKIRNEVMAKGFLKTIKDYGDIQAEQSKIKSMIMMNTFKAKQNFLYKIMFALKFI